VKLENVMVRKCLLLAVALSEFSFAAPISFVTDQVEAIIGMPMTPMSYAGVARRTTRRAVYAGAAVGASAAVYSPYYAPYYAPYAPYYW
jgi:hypothetical protein